MFGYFEEIFHAFLPPPLQTQESASAVYLKPTRVTESFRLRTVHFPVNSPWGICISSKIINRKLGTLTLFSTGLNESKTLFDYVKTLH